jgi:hypothetical protein
MVGIFLEFRNCCMDKEVSETTGRSDAAFPPYPTDLP